MMIPSNSENKVAIVITAAGSSTRMGGCVKKEYLPLGNGTVLSACVNAFKEAAKNQENGFNISHLIVTVPANGSAEAAKALGAFAQDVELVEGSNTRQKSIFNALEYLAKAKVKPDYVLIHDGARPFVSEKIICFVVAGAKEYGASAPGIAPTDTIKKIDDSGFIVEHLERKALTAIQTPQGFEFSKLYEAHKNAASDGKEYTDDTEIWARYCGNVKLVEGEPKNLKITYPGDLEKGAAL